jgi:hypothetical protein
MNSGRQLLNKRFAFFSKADLVSLLWDLFLYAHRARKEGLLSLEPLVKTQKYPLLKDGLRLLCEGTDPGIIKKALETQKLVELELLKTESEVILLSYQTLFDAKEQSKAQWILKASGFKGQKYKALKYLISLIDKSEDLPKPTSKNDSPLHLLLELFSLRLPAEEFEPLYSFLSSQVLRDYQRLQAVVSQGIEAIGAVWHPRDLLLSLQVHLKEDEAKSLDRKFRAWEKKNETSFRQTKVQLNKEAKPKDLKNLALGHLSYLSSNDIALILKEIPVSELAIALFQANLQTRMLFFEELSDRARSMIIEEIETMKEPTEVESKEAQAVILEITRRLIAEGSIQW